MAIRNLAFATLLSAASIAAQSSAPVTEWIRGSAIRLTTPEARHGFADMEPLRKVVGDARIVSLGEATHGSREFFQLKHRMLEFLATQMGFTIFSIEANMPEAYKLNDFVVRGEGDPVKLIKGMYFWTWDTQEVLDMVLWMREFNKSGKGRVEFTGFDMQTPKVALDIVKRFRRGRGPGVCARTWQTGRGTRARSPTRPAVRFRHRERQFSAGCRARQTRALQRIYQDGECQRVRRLLVARGWRFENEQPGFRQSAGPRPKGHDGLEAIRAGDSGGEGGDGHLFRTPAGRQRHRVVRQPESRNGRHSPTPARTSISISKGRRSRDCR